MNLRFNNALLVECDLGGAKNGSTYGAKALFSELTKKPNIIDTIQAAQAPVRESSTPLVHYLSEINGCISKVSSSIKAFFDHNKEDRLVVAAGDHSTACGSVAGFKKAFPDKKIGVVWIDAHADIHSPYTSGSGNVHGMPVAAAVGEDHRERAVNKVDEHSEQLWHETKSICGNAFDFADLVYVGIRDLEQEEWDIIDEHKISFFTVEDVQNRSGVSVAKDALAQLDHCDLIYVSFDIDALDSSLVPGTGTPVSQGIDTSSTNELLATLVSSDKVKLLEVVELNPMLDNGVETAKTISNLLEGVL